MNWGIKVLQTSALPLIFNKCPVLNLTLWKFFLPQHLLAVPDSSSYWSWRRESNPQPADYKSAALPLSHTSEGTVKKVGDLERARTVDLQRDRLAF